MALNGYILKLDYDAVNKLAYEINKIGININQIAKKINSTDKPIWEKELSQARKEIHDLWLQHILKVEEQENEGHHKEQ